MIGNYLYSFGQYCSSFFYTSPPPAEQRALLQQKLSQHVADNEHDALQTLLVQNCAEEWTEDDEMAFAHSLLRNAIEHDSVQAFAVLLDELPLEVLKMRTDDTGQTLPMLAVHAGQTEMHHRYFSTLFDRLTEHYVRLIPLPLVPERVMTDFQAILDTQDWDGNTTLMHAVRIGHEPSVIRLCLSGASTLPQNGAGDSVLNLIAHLPDDAPIVRQVRERYTAEIERMPSQG